MKAIVTIQKKKKLLNCLQKDNKLYPTNAYAMLIGSSVVPNTIKCVLFKGNDRTEIIDMKNFSGPV